MAVRWGLIGASDIAETRMIPAMRRVDGCEIRAVVSANAEHAQRYAARNGIPAHGDNLEAFLADPGIDAVYISSTNEHHLPQAIAAAEAGKHVLCEKPLALRLEDAVAIDRACKEAGVTLGTNHHLRNAATHRALRAAVAEGRIGTPIAARVFHAVSLPDRLRGWRLTRPDSGGGVIMDITVHDADTLRFDLTDDPIEVVAMAASQGLSSNDLPDGVMGVIRFRSGLLAQFHDAFTIGHTGTGLEIHGTEGSLRLTDAMTQEPDGALFFQVGSKVERLDTGSAEDLYERSVRLFRDAVSGSGQPAATGQDGIWSLAVALAVAESASTGQAVAVGPLPS